MNGEIHLITNDNYVKPQPVLDDVVGQEAVIRKLIFFIETHDKNQPFPTTLFTGSHGLGKTYIAEKTAKSLNRRFIVENCGLIKDADDFVENILLGKVVGSSPVTLFLDESHRLSQEITTILLTLLNPNSKMVNTIHHKNWNIVLDMSKVNVIMATTDAYKMFKPLVDRCERIYFESYSNDELLKMLKMYCPDVSHFYCDTNELAEACRGRGRDAFMLSQKINRYIKGLLQPDVFSGQRWNDLKSIFEIYPSGLNRQEVELLKIIDSYGTISSANIALAMMLNVDNIESEIEVRPRELGFIMSTTKGRTLTNSGKKYLENNYLKGLK